MSNIDRTSAKRNPNPCIPFFPQIGIPHENCTKVIYNVLNENVVVPFAVTKWKTDLIDYNVEDLTVYDIFKICFKTTKDSSVQWLQFRILHKNLPVGYYLKKNNIKTTDRCAFCKNNVETIIHVFISC